MNNQVKMKTEAETARVFLLAEAVLSLQRYQPELWKIRFQAAIKSGVYEEWLFEAVLQSYLFLGYPAAIEGLRALSEVVAGKKLYEFEPWSTHAKAWLVRGADTAGAVYQHHLRTLLARLESITPELTEWMIVEGYGKVLSRPRLPLTIREFLLATLLGAGTFIRQFEAHLHGCKNVGTPTQWLITWFDGNQSEISPESKTVWEKFRNKYL